jgi:hypothetical protein
MWSRVESLASVLVKPEAKSLLEYCLLVRRGIADRFDDIVVVVDDLSRGVLKRTLSAVGLSRLREGRIKCYRLAGRESTHVRDAISPGPVTLEMCSEKNIILKA